MVFDRHGARIGIGFGLFLGEGEPMNYEAVESKNHADEWRVEAIDSEGRVFVAIFSGPAAKERATEYASWKNGVHDRELVHAASR
jgi:hypothetical protein